MRRIPIPNKLDVGALRLRLCLCLSYPIIEVLLGEVSAMMASSATKTYFSLFYSSCEMATIRAMVNRQLALR